MQVIFYINKLPINRNAAVTCITQLGGKTVVNTKEGQAAVVESTKAASDVYSPISGEVTEGNKAIADDPGSVNGDPEGASWFFKLKIKDKGELESLMSKDEYDKFCKENPN